MRNTIILLVASQLCGCGWIAWVGYDDPVREPPPGSYMLVDGECFSVGTQNLEEDQRQAVLGAAGRVCEVFKSRELQARVEAQEWIVSCDGSNGSPRTMPGTEVYSLLRQQIPDFSIHSRRPWMAIAQAQKSVHDHTRNRIAIRPERIQSWYSDSSDERGALINTIAHEITHLISFEFRDKGHGTARCPDNRLVSYGVGNLVQELAL